MSEQAELKKRPGRKPTLSPQAIVAAALRVLERDGYEGLTIRGVAAELGVKSASLYWHFATKEQLIDQLSDEVLAGLEAPSPSGDWRQDLRERALVLYRRLTETPGAARLRAGRLVTGPNTLRWMEQGLAIFRRAGLTPFDAAFTSHATHIYIVGAALFAVTPLSAVSADGGSRRAALAAARETFSSLPAETFPNLTSFAEPLTEGGHEARFLYGLDRMIAGIAGAVGASDPTQA
jgi:TetR/AcrR family tetracycline transcriptional repressor